jgi:hypothetical protein
MEAQPCVLGTVTLHMSLKTIYTHWGAHAKCPILLSDSNELRCFSTDIRNLPVGTVMIYADRQRQNRGRTDTTNVRGAFRDLRKAPKNPDLIGFISSFYRKQHKTYFGLPVKCLILLPNFNQIGSSWQIFVKVSSVKFRENPAIRAALIHADGQTRRN